MYYGFICYHKKSSKVFHLFGFNWFKSIKYRSKPDMVSGIYTRLDVFLISYIIYKNLKTHNFTRTYGCMYYAAMYTYCGGALKMLIS